MGEQEKTVKVVETMDVTAEDLEKIINQTLAEGWVLDTIHFAMRESSRRPAMAFLIFYRAEAAEKIGVNPGKESGAKK